MTRSLSPSSSPSRTDRMNDVTEDGEGGGAGYGGGGWGEGGGAGMGRHGAVNGGRELGLMCGG